MRADGVCRSCGAPIVWAATERGRRMPLDPGPYTGDDPRGLFVIHSGVALAVPAGAFQGEPLFRSHFATCPDAAGRRR